MTPEQERILAKSRARQRRAGSIKNKVGAGQAFFRAGGEGFINNLLQLPDLVGTATLKSPGFSPIRKLIEASGQQVPEIGDKVLPLPTANDLFGVAQMTGENAAAFVTGDTSGITEGTFKRLKRAKKQQQELSDIAKTEQPFASAVGSLSGDAATIATGRIPIKGVLSKINPSVLIPEKGLELISKVKMTPGLPRLLDRVLKSKGISTLARAAGRATEAGFEGAALAVLNDDDPLQTAAFTAGTQGIGTAFIELSKWITKGGFGSAGLRIGTAAIGAGSLIQIVKPLIPGGRDSVLESAETGFAKVMYSLLLGGLSALGGFGRLKGTKFAQDLPILSDMLTSLPRNVLFGTVREVLVAEDEGNNVPGVVLDIIAKDPNAFGKEATLLIEKALTQEDVSFTDTVNGLLETSDVFAEKFTQLRQEATQNFDMKKINELFNTNKDAN